MIDDEPVGINSEESVICIVTCYDDDTFVCSRVSGRVILSFCRISNVFAAFLSFLLNFHSFSNGRKARKPDWRLFSSSPRIRGDVFQQKKTNKKPILDTKTRFCGNSHILYNN